MREQQADEDERAGEPADEHVHFHIRVDFDIYWKQAAGGTPGIAPMKIRGVMARIPGKWRFQVD
jgi:hypothetical protein